MVMNHFLSGFYKQMYLISDRYPATFRNFIDLSLFDGLSRIYNLKETYMNYIRNIKKVFP